jgi:hypothetical protein
MSECSGETLRHLTESFWFGIGRDSAAVYGAHEDWLYRRVETIEFIGRHSVKRSVSVDFEVPCGLPSLGDRAPVGTALVPISVLYKWPPLMGFDFIGPTGHPTSRYLGTTNKQLDFGLLLGMAGRALALDGDNGEGACWHRCRGRARRHSETEPELTPALRRELATVVHDPNPSQTAVAQAVNGLRTELNERLDGALKAEELRDSGELATRIAVTVDLAARLAGSSILWVAINSVRRTDQIVKFSYLDESGAPEGWWKRRSIACSWAPRRLIIPLPHAGRHVRYHLDIPAPHGGVEPVAVDAMAFPPAEGAEDVEVTSVENLARKYARLDLPDEWVGPESSRYFMDYGEPLLLASTSPPDRDADDRTATDQTASAEIVDRRTHVYLGPRSAPSHRVVLQIKFAASRQGFVGGCLFAAMTIAVLMSAVFFRLTSAALSLEATVVLLSVVPVVLGYVLVRPDEEALERYHIGGVRLMAMISGATPIVGALILILTHTSSSSDLTSIRPIWGGLVFISWVMAAGLAVGYARAAPSGAR